MSCARLVDKTAKGMINGVIKAPRVLDCIFIRGPVAFPLKGTHKGIKALYGCSCVPSASLDGHVDHFVKVEMLVYLTPSR